MEAVEDDPDANAMRRTPTLRIGETSHEVFSTAAENDSVESSNGTSEATIPQEAKEMKDRRLPRKEEKKSFQRRSQH